MSPRHWDQRARDMISAIEEIQRLAQGHDPASLTQESTTLKAILYNFIVLGEAARTIPDEICDQHASIDWAGIRAMRNVVTHVYFGVSVVRVLDTIQRDLPGTLRALRLMVGIPPSGT